MPVPAQGVFVFIVIVIAYVLSERGEWLDGSGVGGVGGVRVGMVDLLRD